MQLLKILLVAGLFLALGCGKIEFPAPHQPKKVDLTSHFSNTVSGTYQNKKHETIFIDPASLQVHIYFPASSFNFMESTEVSHCAREEKHCYCDGSYCEKVRTAPGRCTLDVYGKIAKVLKEENWFAKGGFSTTLFWSIDHSDLKYVDSAVEKAQAKPYAEGGNAVEQAKNYCINVADKYHTGDRQDWIYYDSSQVGISTFLGDDPFVK